MENPGENPAEPGKSTEITKKCTLLHNFNDSIKSKMGSIIYTTEKLRKSYRKPLFLLTGYWVASLICIAIYGIIGNTFYLLNINFEPGWSFTLWVTLFSFIILLLVVGKPLILQFQTEYEIKDFFRETIKLQIEKSAKQEIVKPSSDEMKLQSHISLHYGGKYLNNIRRAIGFLFNHEKILQAMLFTSIVIIIINIIISAFIWVELFTLIAIHGKPDFIYSLSDFFSYFITTPTYTVTGFFVIYGIYASPITVGIFMILTGYQIKCHAVLMKMFEDFSKTCRIFFVDTIMVKLGDTIYKPTPQLVEEALQHWFYFYVAMQYDSINIDKMFLIVKRNLLTQEDLERVLKVIQSFNLILPEASENVEKHIHFLEVTINTFEKKVEQEKDWSKTRIALIIPIIVALVTSTVSLITQFIFPGIHG